MAQFIRELSNSLSIKLKAEPLFNNKLIPDIKKQTDAVFPAIRNNVVSFYYKGGGLFTYSDAGFSTHKKYAIAPDNHSRNYVLESDLSNIIIKRTYLDAYDDVKDRCKAYGTIEATYVSDLYGYSGLSDSSVILLDTEISLTGESEEDDDTAGTKISRIDLLLYNVDKRKLCFCEAKHFSNSEIWAKRGNKPKVCSQIDRYNKVLSTQADTIIAEYQKYVDRFNNLFGTDLPFPESIHSKTGLLIFGYDSYQQEKIHELLKDDGSLDGTNYYTTGKINSSTIDTLFKKLTKK